MNKTQRFVELLLTMNTRQKFTLQELAQRFGVSKRTMLRDINELSALGVPLYSELGVHGGYRILQERTLPPITFSEHEAVALFLISQSLKYYRALPMESDWRSTLAKFYHVLLKTSRNESISFSAVCYFGCPCNVAKRPIWPNCLKALPLKKSSTSPTNRKKAGPPGTFS